MKLKTGYKALLEAAEREIDTLDLATARALLGDADTVFVDLRDPRELEREGKIPGAFHAPRGMLEFWVDPDSPYHKEVFTSGKRMVFYCQSGWRSALAAQTVKRMGLPRVSHIGDGFAGWKKADAPVETVQRK